MKCGIYLIKCQANGRAYVGSSVDMNKRWSRHKRELNAGRHANAKLQRAWNRHGEEQFEFSVIEVCDRAEMISRESLWIVAHKAVEKGFNIAPDALAPMLGRKHRPETIEAIRAGNTGVAFSELRKQNISKARLGSPGSEAQRIAVAISNATRGTSEATREKLRQVQLGRKKTEEQVAAMSLRAKERWSDPDFANRVKAALTGRTLSEGHKAKISAGGKGIKKSPETIERMKAAAKRRTEATRKRLSESLKGKPKSEEHRAKLSAAAKARYAAKREAEKAP